MRAPAPCHFAPRFLLCSNASRCRSALQFTGGGTVSIFNENEGAGNRTARGGKAGLGGVPKRALQDVTNATQQNTGIVGKKQVSADTPPTPCAALSVRAPRRGFPPTVT
jgi:hypothetical protein